MLRCSALRFGRGVGLEGVFGGVGSWLIGEGEGVTGLTTIVSSLFEARGLRDLSMTSCVWLVFMF